MKMISALVVFCIIAAASAQGRPAYICEVLLDNFCPTNAATCANDPVLNFGSADYGFEHFNLVSFGGMYAPSGDVEGRTAVRNSVELTAYSIGYELRTAGVAANSPSLPYTMVVGRDAKWHGGSVHPDGSGFPYAGPKEYIFVGGDFTQADSYLQNDRTGSCPTTGCLDSYFDYAQGYYKDLSAGFAALANNVNVNVQPWGTIEITCNSMATATYVFTITPATFSTLTFWDVDSNTCNPASTLVVNIVGAGSQVTFKGATQTFFQNQRVLYNVVPTASTPSVRVEVGVNGNLLAPDSQYNQPGMGVFIGQVIVANVVQVHQINLIYCAPPPTPNPNNSTNPLCPAWEADCAGLDLVFGGQTYSFRDMNAISFGSFVADTGDIEGRLAVQNDCTFGLGYSVGYELKTANGIPDRSLPYSLVCGGNGNWGSGSLHPDGTGLPYPGAKEDAFIGGSFTSTQQDLIDRVTGTCGTPGCLDATFNAAKTCYTGYSTSIGAAADNVQHTIADSALNVVCNDASASEYWISIDGSDFASFTYVVTSSCNFQAKWYINIRGTGDFTISGGSWPGVPGGIVYNVIGCGRTVTVKETALGGHLLAPCSTLNQPSGVITGKVVAGDITASLQINRENTCPDQVTVQVPVVVASLNDGNSFESEFTSNFLVNGDKVDGNTVNAYRGDNTYAFASKTGAWTKGQVVFVDADTHSSRTPNAVESGAAAVAVSVALAAFVALAF